jgi:hypothetical protein
VRCPGRPSFNVREQPPRVLDPQRNLERPADRTDEGRTYGPTVASGRARWTANHRSTHPESEGSCRTRRGPVPPSGARVAGRAKRPGWPCPPTPRRSATRLARSASARRPRTSSPRDPTTR